MKRYTMRDALGEAILNDEAFEPGTMPTIKTVKALARLAEYEETGMTPEECEEDALFLEELKKSRLNFADVAGFVAAHEEGRLLVLPCKVGDTVYCLEYTNSFTQVVVPLRVQGISVDNGGRGLVLHFGGYPVLNAGESAFGKRVFFSLEEAEKALEGIG